MMLLLAVAEDALGIIKREAGRDFQVLQAVKRACMRITDEKAIQQLLRGRRNLKLF